MSAWMPEGTNILLFDTATVLFAGLLFALIARRLCQSTLLGYLLAGLIIGPYGLKLVHNEVNIRFLADVGVVLLMFALGVQLSLRQFFEVRYTALVVGLGQVILAVILVTLVGIAFGLPPPSALVLGYAIALCSSVVLVRILGDANAFHTSYGRPALGISLLQDLLAVVMIGTLPFLSHTSATSFVPLSMSLLRAAVFLLWIILFARWGAPAILRWASSTGSREVFLLTVVVLSIAGPC